MGSTERYLSPGIIRLNFAGGVAVAWPLRTSTSERRVSTGRRTLRAEIDPWADKTQSLLVYWSGDVKRCGNWE
eukprot:1310637-Amorphochlora_amoeboformis.AAC.2